MKLRQSAFWITGWPVAANVTTSRKAATLQLKTMFGKEKKITKSC